MDQFLAKFASKNKFYPLFLKNSRLPLNKQGASHRTLKSAFKNGHYDTDVWQYANPQKYITQKNSYGSWRTKMMPFGYCNRFVVDIDGSKFSSIELLLEDLASRSAPIPEFCVQTGYTSFHLVYRSDNSLTPNLGLCGQEARVVMAWIAGVEPTAQPVWEVMASASRLYGVDEQYAMLDPGKHKFRLPGTTKNKEMAWFHVKGVATGSVLKQADIWEKMNDYSAFDIRRDRAAAEKERAGYLASVKKPVAQESPRSGPFRLSDQQTEFPVPPKSISAWEWLKEMDRVCDELGVAETVASPILHGIEVAWPKAPAEEIVIEEIHQLAEDPEPVILDAPRNQSDVKYWADHIPALRAQLGSILPKRYCNRYAEWICSNLTFLMRGELYISQIRLARELNLTQPTVSKHLRLLINSGFLSIVGEYIKGEIPRRYEAGQEISKLVGRHNLAQEKISSPYEDGDTNEQMLEDIRILVHAGHNASDIVDFIDEKMENKPDHKKRTKNEILGSVIDWVEKTNKKIPAKPYLRLECKGAKREDEGWFARH